MKAYVATIFPVGFSSAPEGWQMCQGQQLELNQYQAVYAVIGGVYGGDMSTNFDLPDMRGTMPIGFGQRPGSLAPYQIGAKGGTETVQLGIHNLPAHSRVAESWSSVS